MSTTISVPPTHTRVLVVGGGPGGSMAAILLAREGIDVVLLERDRFPRYHIGESLLTSVIPLLKFVDLYDRVEAHGFVRKHGGYFTLKEGSPPGHIDFRQGSNPHSYQVIRSEFDHMMLEYARESGAQAFEETTVTGVDFDGDRPVRARWQQPGGTTGEITFDHIIDASGLSGLLSSKVLHNRRFQPAFANVAVGSYWRGYVPYVAPDGTEQGGNFFMEALRDGSGWVWAIPLHDQTLSVGVVVRAEDFQRRKAETDDLEAMYREVLELAPQVTDMLAKAEQVQPVRSWRDYSYLADALAGPGYRLIGDAGAFIDPLFSTGVHMAFLGAVSAVSTIASQLRGEIDEVTGMEFHDRCIRRAYVRFAVIVSGMYKQIRQQQELVLFGIDKADFRRAFDIILPLISGSGELDADTVDPGVMGRAIDFTIDMTNEQAQLGTDNAAARLFAEKVPIDEDLASLPDEAVDGWYIRLERGRLGLATVGDQRDELERNKQQLVSELLQVSRP